MMVKSKIGIGLPWLCLPAVTIIAALVLSVCFILPAPAKAGLPAVALAETGKQKRKSEGPVSYTVHAPASVRAGEQFDFTVTFDIEPEWYIYAPTGANVVHGMIETKLTLDKLPPGVEAVGEVQLPEPLGKGPFEVYEGNGVRMSQTLRAPAAGEYKIAGKVRYQTCTNQICLPPRTEKVSVVVVVK